MTPEELERVTKGPFRCYSCCKLIRSKKNLNFIKWWMDGSYYKDNTDAVTKLSPICNKCRNKLERTRKTYDQT